MAIHPALATTALVALIAAPAAARPAARTDMPAKTAPKPAPMDADTAAWWARIASLSSDAMRGRDTGSADYVRAATMVADAFRVAGLRPAGENGSYLQAVPIHEVRVTTTGTNFAISGPKGRTPLRFLHDISVRASTALPAMLDAPLSFGGYCGAAAVTEAARGTVLVCFAGRRAGMPGNAERSAAAIAHGAVGLINIDDIGFSIEPPRWPEAYARSLTLATAPAPMAVEIPTMRLNADALPRLFAGSSHSARSILADAVAARPLASFGLATRLKARFSLTQQQLSSPNILAMLPGTDPALADEALVVSAHLDGYGIGEPVNGDALYNGAFDDAAYVATLIRLAERRKGKGFARPILFAVFTGEEKGLLGSHWFVEHKTVPQRIIADINLDAIRPLFPLKILTLIGLEQSNLVDSVRAVAGPMGIDVRPDGEPERGMIGRTDASPFLKAGIPGVSFMFGYDPGAVAEERYRLWYRTRYHKPADDITQPIDFKAAADFNQFFYTLAARVAADPAPPRLTPQ
jgi:hypothetical protein